MPPASEALLDVTPLVIRLGDTMAALRDLHLRAAVVEERLRAWPATTSVAVLDVARALAEAGNPRALDLLTAVSAALAPADRAELRRRLTDAALASRRDEVAAWLRRWPLRREPGAAARRVPDFGKGRPVTLGERKSLARRMDRKLLRRVLQDPHPDVVRIVLRNPALTEDDVVRLAARRPVAPEVLRELFASQRWLARYRVRLALLRNPWCPLDVALQLVPQLRRADLRAAMGATELDPTLRAACARAVRRPDSLH